ncbi:uncharacterized protein B0I36DRAFT_333521 [Microdochium trichocladiopsis]|uniref:Secreted protein n=1 Tax=Microdochium trichocladiopsis TaxID=1682393 RepID=A0A9P8XX28_9PEZI|nr:uncharacterized protein B0I36DRAFT_333521 [Microdochium trichocladiopsis]KAH7020957.1 hypothetical protein B0I36DRAFT_333521 [Microdochium trichocladiopsis]
MHGNCVWWAIWHLFPLLLDCCLVDARDCRYHEWWPRRLSNLASWAQACSSRVGECHPLLCALSRRATLVCWRLSASVVVGQRKLWWTSFADGRLGLSHYVRPPY